MKSEHPAYRIATVLLRLSLVAALFLAGWWIYTKTPARTSHSNVRPNLATDLRIVLRHDNQASTLAIPVEIYPIDVVAVRHEYFAERRAGKRFEDFLQERMKGRSPVYARLDNQGQTSVLVSPGNWWIHATLPGDEDLEWRLPVEIGGDKQTIELTPENVYTRARIF